MNLCKEKLLIMIKVMFCVLAIFLFVGMVMADVPQLINYQGQLLDGNGEALPDGAYDMAFAIYDQPTGGTQYWSEVQTGIIVSNGFFSTMLGSLEPLNDTVFAGPARYLEVSVQGVPITPRTRFTSVAYSNRISTIDGARAGRVSGSLQILPSDFDSTGNALVIGNANAVPVVQISVDATGATSLSLFDPVDSKADLKTSMRLSVASDGFGSLEFFDPVDSKNDLFGNALPVIELTKNGLIMYGETELDTNLIVQPNGDIRGLGQITMGENSSDGVQTAVLGYDNEASGDSSAIGGGSFNVTTGESSVIGGGFSNNASGAGSTIGGGSTNDVSGEYATIGGGFNNSAQGDYSTIPGGDYNNAKGTGSYAAGHRAVAEHDGAFVWADMTDQDFMSTGNDQFLIRAGGGVGIGTNDPQGVLDVAGPSGNASVNLPDDAIGNAEIFDEPGVSAATEDVFFTLNKSANVFSDVAVTTITIPSDGYIMLTAGGILETTGTTGQNQAYLQIDETPGGGPEAPFYTMAGAGDQDSPNSVHRYSMSTQRFYFKQAGTYEFRVETMAVSSNGGSAITRIVNPYISAMYFPTAYGDVATSLGTE